MTIPVWIIPVLLTVVLIAIMNRPAKNSVGMFDGIDGIVRLF